MQGSHCKAGGENPLDSAQSQGGQMCPSSIYFFLSHPYLNCNPFNFMPGDLNLVSQVSSRIRIDFNASILVAALGFLIKSSCASTSLGSPHPLPFPETPPLLPAQTTKGRAVPAPSRCPAPSPNVAVLRRKEVRPDPDGVESRGSVASSFLSSANR